MAVVSKEPPSIAEAMAGFDGAMTEKRSRIAQLQAERETLDRAAAPKAAAIARAREWIEKQATQALVGLASLPRNDSAAGHFPHLLPPDAKLPGFSSAMTALLCRLVPDQVERVLVEEIERHHQQAPIALAPEERDRQLARIDAELRQIEIDEERTARTAERSGFRVTRRGDASPEIVLASDRDLGLEELAA